MRAELGEKDIVIVLSRRNIRSLLAKLDGYPADSVMTVYRELSGAQRGALRDIVRAGTQGLLWITAEEDEVHYAHPEREGTPPGRMHPDTEGVL